MTIAAGVGVALCLAFQLNLLSSTQLRSTDFLFRTTTPDQSIQLKDTIVMVAIDDKSLEQLGRLSSWPRTYHASVIDTLAKAQARAIVFDVLFSEPASGDERLAASIKSAGNVIAPLTGISLAQHTTSNKTIEFDSFIRPLKPLEQNAIALGHAIILPDDDGVVRRLPLVISSGEDYKPALALVTAAIYRQHKPTFDPSTDDSSLSFGGQIIPVDNMNCMLINYVNSAEEAHNEPSFSVISFVDVLKGNADPSVFRNRIVLIGATAVGLGDFFWTPMGKRVNGVEIHAHAINTILSGNFLSPAPAIFTIITILLIALFCGFAVIRFRVLWAVLSAIIMVVVYLIAVSAAFDKGIILNMVYPPLTVLCTFVGITLYRITSEQSEKREITKIFGRYVPSQVVDKILEALEDGNLKLEGEQRQITVMFADIRGFTGLSDTIEPEKLITALNAHLSAVIQAILNYDGVINKFGGDSVMAVWNAPTDCEEHASLAIKAAIEAQHALKELQQKDAALPAMEFGIGINTGDAVAGNIGSEDRLEYAVIGDTVNLASRLTAVTPGGKIWIGSSTFDLIKGKITARQLEPLTFKGKKQPFTAYEIIDTPNVTSHQVE